jgi:hypothetical protein
MGDTVEALQLRMSSAEFTQWLAYNGVEPFGYEMETWRFGMVASAIVNAIYASAPRGPRSRRPKILKPHDFYPPTRASRGPRLTKAQADHIERKRKACQRPQPSR